MSKNNKKDTEQCTLNSVILPCPFCGSECSVEGIEFGDNPTTYYRVTCKEEHSLDWWSDTQQDAVDVWNQRHGV